MASQIIQNRVYDKDYFSGTQAALYIGDVFVDEVVNFQFRVQQKKVPIYGYASSLFDAVSKGQVLVAGSFSINFKETAYLYLILQRYKKLNQALGQLNLGFNNGKFVKQPRGVPSPFQNDEKKILRQSVERLIQGTATKAERYEFYNSLAGFASQVGEDTFFEDWAEAFEDEVWGTASEDLDSQIRRTDDSFFDGFDMYFTYGDFNNPEANHTVERISNIYLTGREKAVNISGEPIVETYDFFARNSF